MEKIDHPNITAGKHMTIAIKFVRAGYLGWAAAAIHNTQWWLEQAEQRQEVDVKRGGRMSHAYAGMANGALGLADMAARRSVHHKGNQMGDLNSLQKNRPVYFKLRMFWTEDGDRTAGARGTRDFQTGPSL